MTTLAWLEERSPAPPPRLATRMRDAVRTAVPDETVAAPETLLAAGTHLLRGLLAERRQGRDSALDLLAADALVTYAFEAAAAEPTALEARASAAMRALASLTEPRP